MNNFLVTGIPRSGTSLLLKLLSNKSNLCFSEPPWLKSLRENSIDGLQLSINLQSKIESLRTDIGTRKAIEMVYGHSSNEVPDNYFSRDQKLIKNIRAVRSQIFDTQMRNADIFVKANALFIANLKQLEQHDFWKIIPIVRDPIAVLMSWRSVNIASSKGRVKVVEKYSDELIEIGQNSPLLKRQVLLLDWYFKQLSVFDKAEIIFYEDLINNPNNEIKKHYVHSNIQSDRFESKNNNQHYDKSEKDKILKALKLYGNHLRDYYPEYK